MKKLPKHIYAIDDERELDNGVIVTLAEPYCYKIDPGCGVRGFDSVSDALKESRLKDVYKKEVK